MNLQPFQNYLLKQKIRPSTCKVYLYVADRFISDNPDFTLMGFNQISKWLGAYIHSKPRRPSMSLFQAGIKQFYSFLFQEGMIPNHPCRNLYIKTRRIGVNPELLFAQQELLLLLNRHERYKALTERNRAIISFLLYQALSVGQICNLKVGDLDMENASVNIKRYGAQTRRNLPLKPSQVKLLQDYLNRFQFPEEINSKSPLFISSNGGPILADSIHYLVSTFKPLFPDRNLNPKSIRKSVIANWLNDYQLPVEDVQFMAGHKQPTSTLRYKIPDISESVRLVNLYFPSGKG